MVQSYEAIQIANLKEIPAGIDIDEYAFLHPTQFEKISGKKKHQITDKDGQLYLRVSKNKIKVYLKYFSRNIPGNDVMLSYSNLCRIGIVKSNDRKVDIRKVNWIRFMWNNNNTMVKWSFRVTTFSLLSAICSLIQFCFDLYINCY